jgi:hypothetical protein
LIACSYRPAREATALFAAVDGDRSPRSEVGSCLSLRARTLLTRYHLPNDRPALVHADKLGNVIESLISEVGALYSETVSDVRKARTIFEQQELVHAAAAATWTMLTTDPRSVTSVKVTRTDLQRLADLAVDPEDTPRRHRQAGATDRGALPSADSRLGSARGREPTKAQPKRSRICWANAPE